ncbi:TPA: hypothetical protein ACHVI3_001889, partial [Streptococcus suis]
MRMENKNHIFYSVIGKHGNETIEQIINRKRNEIENAGYSLWSAKIDKKSTEQVWALSEDETVWVFCKISDNAKDPVTNDICRANKMIGPKGSISIHQSVTTTFSKGRDYQAYVVEEYLDFRENPLKCNLANYISTLSNNKKVSFGDRFKNTRFQNVYGLKIEHSNLEQF